MYMDTFQIIQEHAMQEGKEEEEERGTLMYLKRRKGGGRWGWGDLGQIQHLLRRKSEGNVSLHAEMESAQGNPPQTDCAYLLFNAHMLFRRINNSGMIHGKGRGT